MINYVEKIVDGVNTYFDLNLATLSGAIDIIVVVQPDGTLRSTPFHVRFGKLLLLRSREKTVTLKVNGEELTEVHMKLGNTGEAFFVVETFEDVPAHMCTSPLPSSVHSGSSNIDLAPLSLDFPNETSSSVKASPQTSSRLAKSVSNMPTQQVAADAKKGTVPSNLAKSNDGLLLTSYLTSMLKQSPPPPNGKGTTAGTDIQPERTSDMTSKSKGKRPR